MPPEGIVRPGLNPGNKIEFKRPAAGIL